MLVRPPWVSIGGGRRPACEPSGAAAASSIEAVDVEERSAERSAGVGLIEHVGEATGIMRG